MRNFLSILLISFSFFAYSQTSKKITLCTDDKTTLHNFSFWLDVKVKSADTSFFYALHSNKKDVIEVLKEGKYTLTFNSIFGDKITKEIVIGKKAKYKLKVKGLNAMYGKVPTTNNFSDRLSNGDTLYFIYSTTGKDVALEKMAVTKLANGRYMAMLFKGLTNEVFMEYGCDENTFSVVKSTEKLLKEKKQET
ncbi:MAG: hypothetical protein IPG89_17110 [Bacteroidetes bacterium]|nr:hypothetical protein [Bacteroidota bacterium]